MDSLKSKLLLIVLLISLCGAKVSAQNGMYFDSKHSFLIPMLENNVLIGHAYVYLLDKVSKDSSSFIIDVYDEYLRDVGQKKFTLDSKFTFSAAVYNGTNIVTKFEKKDQAIRYIVFDKNASVSFDTTISIKVRNITDLSEITFQQTPLYAVNHQGVLDYLTTETHGMKSTTIQCLTNENNVWQYTQVSAYPQNVQLVAADNKYIVNAVYTYRHRKHFNDVTTSIQLLSAYGVKIAETNLFKDDSVSIYPISAEIQKNGIEIISQFTTRSHEFSKVKYGTCIHFLDLNGKIVREQYNEFTKSLVKDSVVKKYKLLVNSYLYMHKAVKLKNGDWLVAAEQLLRTKLRIRPFRNPYVVFNKKNICLLELDDRGGLVKIHVEPNKDDGVRLPKKYYRRPQNGAVVANAKERMDINYFVRDEKTTEENISFVFTDYNYHSKKFSLGNLLYKNGEINVDRFVVPTFSTYTRIGILPARYGHVLLIKYDPKMGLFDFDTIKFNN